MKMKRLLACTILGFALTACGTSITPQDAIIPMEAKLADHQIRTGQIGDIVVSADFSNAELEALFSALDYYEDFRKKWTFAGSFEERDFMTTFDTDYQKLRTHYLELQFIVVEHWDEYDDTSRHKLMLFHKRALRLHQVVEDNLHVQNSLDAVNNALAIGATFARILSL